MKCVQTAACFSTRLAWSFTPFQYGGFELVKKTAHFEFGVRVFFGVFPPKTFVIFKSFFARRVLPDVDLYWFLSRYPRTRRTAIWKKWIPTPPWIRKNAARKAAWTLSRTSWFERRVNKWRAWIPTSGTCFCWGKFPARSIYKIQARSCLVLVSVRLLIVFRLFDFIASALFYWSIDWLIDYPIGFTVLYRPNAIFKFWCQNVPLDILSTVETAFGRKGQNSWRYDGFCFRSINQSTDTSHSYVCWRLVLGEWMVDLLI